MDSVGSQRFPAQVVCVHARACPGCPLIEIAYAEQLAWKRSHVCAALRPYPELSAVAPGLPRAPRSLLGYRARAKLVVSGTAIGLFGRGTHSVVDTPECQVLDPLVKELIQLLRRSLRTLALDGVDVARVADQLLVTLIAQPTTDEGGLRELAGALQSGLPAVAGVAFTRRDSQAVQLLSAGHTRLLGVSELRCSSEAGQPYHYVAFGAFMQAHAETSSAIYRQLTDLVLGAARERSAPPRVLELYAGSGALSLALAARGASVTAVESYAPACERLIRAAREQSFSIEVREGDAGEQLQKLGAESQRFDVVLVNPPRRGLGPEVRTQLAELLPSAIGYVSCRPSTLARDLAHLARLGYRAVEATPYDMMPLTDQVETLVWLTGAAPPAPTLLYEAPQLVAFDKHAHEPVTGPGPQTLCARVRKGQADAAAVPLTTLTMGSSGVVLFARNEEAHGKAGATTEPTYIALVRGVVRERGTLRASGRTARYRRLLVAGGHSLVEVVASSDEHVARAFGSIGHPVIGDRKRDRASAQHFLMRHGLDRWFLHLSTLRFDCAGEPVEVRSRLAPDLVAVLESLGGSTLLEAVEQHTEGGAQV